MGRLEEINEKENDDSEGGNRGERLKQEEAAAEGRSPSRRFEEGSSGKKTYREEQEEATGSDRAEGLGREAIQANEVSSTVCGLFRSALFDYAHRALSSSAYMRRKRARAAQIRRLKGSGLKQTSYANSRLDRKMKGTTNV